jgi:hypothetical protein
MKAKQEKALEILFGQAHAEVIKAWCQIVQDDDPIKWMKEILLTEIDEYWSSNNFDYPAAKISNRLILDRFCGIGSFNVGPLLTEQQDSEY